MQIALVTIVTSNLEEMVKFYSEVLGIPVKFEQGGYVEFVQEGVRFALCTSDIMFSAIGDPGYTQPHSGHAFELSFPCPTPADVDTTYAALTTRSARPVKAPADVPWGQRVTFFADPGGNIHELFADLPKK